jgi:hypothetical protein
VGGGYRRIGLRYAVSGPYETLVKFLARLEMATPPLGIDNLQIRRIAAAGHRRCVDAGCGARCLRLPQ